MPCIEIVIVPSKSSFVVLTAVASCQKDNMSEDNHTPEPGSCNTKLVIQLTSYKTKDPTGKSKRKVEEKEIKTKELVFTLARDNHLAFLSAVLTRLSLNTQYKVTDKKRFGFKYLYPVSKA